MEQTKIKTEGRLVLFLIAILLFCLCLPSTVLAEPSLSLKNEDVSMDIPLAVEDMFPGDKMVRDYSIQVSHNNSINLYFRADIHTGYEVLAEVLKVKVELPVKGITLYNGLIRDMPNALEHQLNKDEQSLLYRITVYLDSTVGSITELDKDGKRYMNQEMMMDYRWWFLDDTPDVDSVKVKLAAEKLMDGKYPRGNDFTFLLSDDNGDIVQKVKNNDGLIDFDTLIFEELGSYIYYVTEQKGSNSKINYDDTEFLVRINVREGNGALVSEVSFEKDGELFFSLPRFANTTVGTPDHTDAPKDPDEPDPPKLGDESNINFWIGIFAGSLIVITILLFLLKPRKGDKAHE